MPVSLSFESTTGFSVPGFSTGGLPLLGGVGSFLSKQPPSKTKGISKVTAVNWRLKFGLVEYIFISALFAYSNNKKFNFVKLAHFPQNTILNFSGNHEKDRFVAALITPTLKHSGKFLLLA